MGPDKLIAVARTLAAEAHEGQKRKYSGEPYIVHPRRVADKIQAHGFRPEMVAAAWLHDVVEDCDVDLGYIYGLFGADVGNLVMWLTNRSKGVSANRATRKAIDLEVLRHAPPDVQAIKYADLIDNTADIVKFDRKFAQVYMTEKKALLQGMRGGDWSLWREAWQNVLDWEESQ